MAVKTGELESELIEAVIDRVRDRLPDAKAGMAESFVRQYYHWVPSSDLAGRSEEDLYAVAIAQWELAQERQPHEAKVRVYDGGHDADGENGAYTFIDLVSDDMPFIVDSVTMELSRLGCTIGLVIHPVIRVRRDPDGRLIGVAEPLEEASDSQAESILHAEVSREHDPGRVAELTRAMERVLEEVDAAVADWQAMRGRMLELAEGLGESPGAARATGPLELEEAMAFLRWVADDHFVLLGYREYELRDPDGDAQLEAVPGSGLGILRGPPAQPRKSLTARAAALARGPQPLVLTKANSVATIHRPARLDYIGVKRFDTDGRVLGEHRFLGLYTTSAYRAGALTTPVVREKVRYVLDRASFPAGSHDASGPRQGAVRALAGVVPSGQPRRQGAGRDP